MKEQTVIVKSAVDLEAILATPDKEVDKAFLIVSGSGKGDMDGNFKSFKLNLYKYLSDYLIKEGYATLRYNKRGVGNSKGIFNETGLYDLIEDMNNAVLYLKEKYNSVYIIGHSEGAIIASLYNEKNNVDGLILLSGAGTDLKTAMNYQQQNTLEEIKNLSCLKGKLLRLLVKEEKLWDRQNKFYERIESSKKDCIRIQLVPIQAKWMREHFTYNKEAVLEKLKEIELPTLVITGSKDVQADVQDLVDIENLGNKNITTVSIDNMTHMLRILDGEKSMLNLKKQYKGDIKKPLSEELYNTITNWLDKLEK